MSYVVVLFSLSPCAEGFGTLSRCPMEALGPFDTSDEAHEVAGQGYSGFEPHILHVREPPRG